MKITKKNRNDLLKLGFNTYSTLLAEAFTATTEVLVEEIMCYVDVNANNYDFDDVLTLADEIAEEVANRFAAMQRK